MNLDRIARVIELFVTGYPVEPFQIAGYTVMLDTKEEIQRGIYLGDFETDETKWIHSVLKPGMTVVDVGSNVGYYSLIASSIVGGTGRVYSFDPGEYAFKKLRDSVQRNGIKNILAYNVGLSDVNENKELSILEKTLYSRVFITGANTKQPRLA